MNISPKLAASWSPFTDFSLRGSVGTGFKAPDFEQMYLNWTNAAEGYSVFGSQFVSDGFKKFRETGQIAEVLIDPSYLKPLKPERSLAFDAGFSWNFNDLFDLRTTLFRNNITDLIDFLPIAIKTNGMRFHTYTNLSRIYTQGIETRVRVKPLKHLTLEVNYQYLQAYDQDVLDSIRAGKIYKIGATGIFRPVQEVEYGGLLNRSNHSGSIRLIYTNTNWGLNASLRGTFRNRYGLQDINGNKILDDDKEYAPSYSLWNATISKTIYKFFNLQGGVDNIFNRSSIKMMTLTPGRTFFINIIFNYIFD